MICISVTPESRQLAKVDILNASRQCDLVEVCLDHLLKEPDVKEMIDGAKKPILLSCRRPEDGGKFDGTDEERTALLRQAIVAAPEYIELDADTARQIPRFGKVKRVISYTSLNRPMNDIESTFDEAAKLQADVIKFCWPTPSLEAAWPLLATVSQKRAIPVVGLGFGQAGVTFSLLGRKYGSPWIYAALEKGMEAFPGQLTVHEMDEIHRWRTIDAKTRFFGVAGFNPTAIALTKVLNAGFDSLQLNTRCLPFDFKTADQIPKMLDILKIPAVIGTPATGRRLLELSQTREEVAFQSQFSDLLLKQADGWQAFNLIWKIALRNIEETLGRKSAEDRPLDRRNALIVGDGGLAQSLVVGAKRRNGLVSICGADDAEASKVATATDSRFIPLGKLYDTLADVVAVTVPNLDLGNRKTPINPAILRSGATFIDLSGLPFASPLAEEAKQRGCKVVSSATIFEEYVGSIFKSLTGQDLPAESLTVLNE